MSELRTFPLYSLYFSRLESLGFWAMNCRDKYGYMRLTWGFRVKRLSVMRISGFGFWALAVRVQDYFVIQGFGMGLQP